MVTTHTTYVSRSGNHTAKGVQLISDRTWAANVHVDLSRWIVYFLFGVFGRTYSEAQGELVEVGR